jgi:hypothetical protein
MDSVFEMLEGMGIHGFWAVPAIFLGIVLAVLVVSYLLGMMYFLWSTP